MATVQWLGHATFRIVGEVTIYIDPWKVDAAAPKADIILVSHSHFDHLSAPDIERIAKRGTVIYTARDCAQKLHGNVRGMTPGDEASVSGVRIRATRAYNPAKQFHPRNNGWLGFIVTIDREVIYYAGDTDEIPEMEVVFVQTDEPSGPFGAKSIAELSIDGVAPALVNAVHHATGVWMRDLPLTPDVVWRYLRQGK